MKQVNKESKIVVDFILRKLIVNAAMNLPGTFLISFSRLPSLDGGLVFTMFSRWFILSFWSFNSNSTFRNPALYNNIDRIETIVAKKGKLGFGTVISVIPLTIHNELLLRMPRFNRPFFANFTFINLTLHTCRSPLSHCFIKTLEPERGTP